LHRTTTSP